MSLLPLPLPPRRTANARRLPCEGLWPSVRACAALAVRAAGVRDGVWEVARVALPLREAFVPRRRKGERALALAHTCSRRRDARQAMWG